MRAKLGMLLLASALCLPQPLSAAEKRETPEVYTRWLEELKDEMIDRGISKRRSRRFTAKTTIITRIRKW